MIDDDMPRVAILFKEELHPAHAGMADYIGADRIPLQGIDNELIAGSILEDIQGVLRGVFSVPTDYDVYLSEDAIGLYAAPFLNRKTDAIQIYLAANHRTYGLQGYNIGPVWNLSSAAKRIDRTIDVRVLRTSLRRYIDGVVAVSGLMARNISSISPKTPVRVAHGYVEPTLFDQLVEVDPSLDTQNAVFVGENRPYKGVDKLIKAWPAVRKRYPQAKLELVGKGHKDYNVDGITTNGYIEDLTNAYRSASLCIHPARIDPFPVSVLEAMCAGVPTIGTTNCGVSPYLADVDTKLQCEPTVDSLAKAIISYFDRDINERQQLSEAIQTQASAFDSERSKRAFAEQFGRILRDIHTEKHS